MKDFSKGNQGCLKAKVPGLAQIDPIAPASRAPNGGLP